MTLIEVALACLLFAHACLCDVQTPLRDSTASQSPSTLSQSVQECALESVLDGKFDHWVTERMKEWGVPGVALIVTRENEDKSWTDCIKSYGQKNRLGEPVDSNTLFDIASNSKLFTAFTLGLALESNKSLSWNSRVRDILPKWHPQDPTLREHGTLKDILSHRTGMPRHDSSYHNILTPEETVYNIQYLKPSAEFRDVWQYNNIMYMTAAFIARTVLSADSFIGLVEKLIFRPLDFASATYNCRDAFASGNLVEGYVEALEPGEWGTAPNWQNKTYRPTPYYEDLDIIEQQAGPGDILIDSNDMLIWLKTLLLEGRDHRSGKQVIPQSVVQYTATGVIPMRPSSGATPELSDIIYGAAQEMRSYKGHRMIEHGGGMPGFMTQITRFPDAGDRLGVSVLTNSDAGSSLLDIVKFRVIDLMLGHDLTDWNQRQKDKYRVQLESDPLRGQESVADASPPILPPRVSGSWQNPAYGTLELCPTSTAVLSDVRTSKFCRKLVPGLFKLLPDLACSDEKQETCPVIGRFVETRVFNPVVVFHGYNATTYNATAAYAYIVPDKNDMTWAPNEAPFLIDELGRELLTLTLDFSTRPHSDSISHVSEEIVGLGLRGIWAAERGVSGPRGDTVETNSEVYFTKRNK